MESTITTIYNIDQNRQHLDALKELHRHGRLVPFVGAGFSVPACPGWGGFLETFFQGLKRDGFLKEGDEAHYRQLEKGEENPFEHMADWLMETGKRLQFSRQLKEQFDRPLPPDMTEKFRLLHRAFPGLKVTTNFDRLIENSSVSGSTEVCRGNHDQEMKRLTASFTQNSLLKIHGGIRDMETIILSTQQYESAYGDATAVDMNALLPRTLASIFSRFSMLFIGCSLYSDRTLTVMQRLPLDQQQAHYAIMKVPGCNDEKADILRRLADFGITPIWITDYRHIETLLQHLAPEPPPSVQPTGVNFVGREPELAQIRDHIQSAQSAQSGGGVQVITGRLFTIDGAGGVGKTTLAIEASTRLGHLFRDGVFPPIRADEHSPASFVKHLAALFHIDVPEPPDRETAQAMVSQLLKEKQALIILDNAVYDKDGNDSLLYMLPRETEATILVTTRNRELCRRIRINFDRLPVREIRLERFSEAEALALFRRMLDSEYREDNEALYLEIAASLGYLPIALRQAIATMLFGVCYSAQRLRDLLVNDDRLKLLRQGANHLDHHSDSRTVETVFDLSQDLLTPALSEALQYLAACAPGPVPLPFLEKLADSQYIEEALENLFSLSWCEKRDSGEAAAEKQFELHQLVRELVHHRFGNRFSERMVTVVHETYTDESVHFSLKDRWMPQLEEALVRATEAKDERLKDWLYALLSYCSTRGYGDFFVRLSQRVEALFPEDKWTLRTVYAHRALILKDWGKLDEAMTLHKKEEKIEEELGNRQGLATSYANQALILKDWGKLDEAMTLHKKEEKINEELGNRQGLAASYANQALILKDWGKLDEAMTLHKKHEKIEEELGNSQGLAASYANQAVILHLQGKLDEAMTLHKKEEKIYDELGNRQGLARSRWNQGIIHGRKGDARTQAELWRKSIEMNKSIGIPTEDDEKLFAELMEKIEESG